MEGIEKTSIQRWIAALSAVKKDSKHSTLSAMALEFASRPRRQRVSVNLSKLNSTVNDSDNVIVPGKILATGAVTKKFTVAAIELSERAAHQLRSAGCHVVSVDEILKKDAVRIIV